MVSCKVCNEQYHACSSCGIEIWEHYFCSQSCLEQFRQDNLPSVLAKYGITTNELKQLLTELEPFHLGYFF